MFLERGWDGVSIEEISRASGVAKGFIYARYPDKGRLFVEAIERLTVDVAGALNFAGPLPDDVEEGLLMLGRRLLDVSLTPDALAFYRQVVAEAGRLSDLARRFVDRANPLHVAIGEVLQAYAARGTLVVGDCGLATEHFGTLVVGVARTRVRRTRPGRRGGAPAARRGAAVPLRLRQQVSGCPVFAAAGRDGSIRPGHHHTSCPAGGGKHGGSPWRSA